MKNLWSQLKSYPSAVAGLILISVLVGIAVYALAAIPYSEAVRLWRGGDNVWLETPRNARPAWLNFFYKEKQPVTTVVRSTDDPANKTVLDLGGGVAINDMVLEFEFNYDGFPTELAVFFESVYEAARPNVNMTWVTPDGRAIPLSELSVRPSEAYRISQDTRLALSEAK